VKKIMSLVAASMFGLMASTFAGAAPFGYVEGGLGLTAYDIEGADADSSMGFNFVGGLGLNEYFGIELGWMYLGESDIKIDDVDYDDEWEGLETSFSTSGLTLGIRASIPINEQIALYVRPGIYRWKSKFEASYEGQSESETSDTESDMYLGFGMKFQVNNNFLLGGEFTHITLEDESANRFGVTAGFTFGK
jgi:opacity protein-like surface antigen